MLFLLWSPLWLPSLPSAWLSRNLRILKRNVTIPKTDPESNAASVNFVLEKDTQWLARTNCDFRTGIYVSLFFLSGKKLQTVWLTQVFLFSSPGPLPTGRRSAVPRSPWRRIGRLRCCACAGWEEPSVVDSTDGSGSEVTIEWYVLIHLCCNGTLFLYLGRFPFVRSGRSDQSVLKWNARVLRTGSGENGPAHGSEPLSSPAPVGQSAVIRRVLAGKMYACALVLSI